MYSRELFWNKYFEAIKCTGSVVKLTVYLLLAQEPSCLKEKILLPIKLKWTQMFLVGCFWGRVGVVCCLLVLKHLEVTLNSCSCVNFSIWFFLFLSSHMDTLNDILLRRGQLKTLEQQNNYSNETNLCILRVKEHILNLVSFCRRQEVLLAYFKGKMCVTACLMPNTTKLWFARCSQICKVNPDHKCTKGYLATNEMQKLWLLYSFQYANISKLELSWKPGTL